jgi:hypothetical protein
MVMGGPELYLSKSPRLCPAELAAEASFPPPAEHAQSAKAGAQRMSLKGIRIHFLLL